MNLLGCFAAPKDALANEAAQTSTLSRGCASASVPSSATSRSPSHAPETRPLSCDGQGSGPNPFTKLSISMQRSFRSVPRSGSQDQLAQQEQSLSTSELVAKLTPQLAKPWLGAAIALENQQHAGDASADSACGLIHKVALSSMSGSDADPVPSPIASPSHAGRVTPTSPHHTWSLPNPLSVGVPSNGPPAAGSQMQALSSLPSMGRRASVVDLQTIVEHARSEGNDDSHHGPPTFHQEIAAQSASICPTILDSTTFQPPSLLLDSSGQGTFAAPLPQPPPPCPPLADALARDSTAPPSPLGRPVSPLHALKEASSSEGLGSGGGETDGSNTSSTYKPGLGPTKVEHLQQDTSPCAGSVTSNSGIGAVAGGASISSPRKPRTGVRINEHDLAGADQKYASSTNRNTEAAGAGSATLQDCHKSSNSGSTPRRSTSAAGTHGSTLASTLMGSLAVQAPSIPGPGLGPGSNSNSGGHSFIARASSALNAIALPGFRRSMHAPSSSGGAGVAAGGSAGTTAAGSAGALVAGSPGAGGLLSGLLKGTSSPGSPSRPQQHAGTHAPGATSSPGRGERSLRGGSAFYQDPSAPVACKEGGSTRGGSMFHLQSSPGAIKEGSSTRGGNAFFRDTAAIAIKEGGSMRGGSLFFRESPPINIKEGSSTRGGNAFFRDSAAVAIKEGGSTRGGSAFFRDSAAIATREGGSTRGGSAFYSCAAGADGAPPSPLPSALLGVTSAHAPLAAALLSPKRSTTALPSAAQQPLPPPVFGHDAQVSEGGFATISRSSAISDDGHASSHQLPLPQLLEAGTGYTPSPPSNITRTKTSSFHSNSNGNNSSSPQGVRGRPSMGGGKQRAGTGGGSGIGDGHSSSGGVGSGPSMSAAQLHVSFNTAQGKPDPVSVDLFGASPPRTSNFLMPGLPSFARSSTQQHNSEPAGGGAVSNLFKRLSKGPSAAGAGCSASGLPGSSPPGLLTGGVTNITPGMPNDLHDPLGDAQLMMSCSPPPPRRPELARAIFASLANQGFKVAEGGSEGPGSGGLPYVLPEPPRPLTDDSSSTGTGGGGYPRVSNSSSSCRSSLHHKPSITGYGSGTSTSGAAAGTGGVAPFVPPALVPLPPVPPSTPAAVPAWSVHQQQERMSPTVVHGWPADKA